MRVDYTCIFFSKNINVLSYFKMEIFTSCQLTTLLSFEPLGPDLQARYNYEYELFILTLHLSLIQDSGSVFRLDNGSLVLSLL